ncbi:MAG: threonylcarbamoyl-AMP synthase [Chloroflexi bacterium]|nr:threonylcarbamoyl-AMP synthase [Chloroflexota bacterium]
MAGNFRKSALPCYTPSCFMCNEPDGELARQLGAATRVLRGGGIVAYPTDTVYGLGCNALNSIAVVRVYEVKKRPRHLALPILIPEVGQLPSVARSVPRAAMALAERFWPGALTLVLPKQDRIPDIVTARCDRVAVRVPAHPVPAFLCRALGAPLIGTSANLHGMPSCRTAREVRRHFAGEVDLVIDGESPGGVESTVVDFKEDVPEVIREGAIAKETILQICREAGLCA